MAKAVAALSCLDQHSVDVMAKAVAELSCLDSRHWKSFEYVFIFLLFQQENVLYLFKIRVAGSLRSIRVLGRRPRFNSRSCLWI